MVGYLKIQFSLSFFVFFKCEVIILYIFTYVSRFHFKIFTLWEFGVLCD